MTFDDIIGNDGIKLQLRIAGQAAQIHNRSIPHVMFAGAAGCGKTTMAKALSNSQDSDFLKIPPESMKSAKDVQDLAESLCVQGYTSDGRQVGKIRPTIVFFDEVHQMPLKGQEALGIAMEEWYVASKSPYTGEITEYWMPKFTIVGATTLVGKLSKPFRDRFKLIFQFDTYNLPDSISIVKKHAELRNLRITNEGAEEIAIRARGVPRTMVGYLERVADAITVMGIGTISKDAAESTFKIMGVDRAGLVKNDVKLLTSLYETGQPVGIDTLAIMLNESNSTIQRSREPYLIQRGLMVRTGKGRMITQKGIEYLKENDYIQVKRRFANG